MGGDARGETQGECPVGVRGSKGGNHRGGPEGVHSADGGNYGGDQVDDVRGTAGSNHRTSTARATLVHSWTPGGNGGVLGPLGGWNSGGELGGDEGTVKTLGKDEETLGISGKALGSSEGSVGGWVLEGTLRGGDSEGSLGGKERPFGGNEGTLGGDEGTMGALGDTKGELGGRDLGRALGSLGGALGSLGETLGSSEGALKGSEGLGSSEGTLGSSEGAESPLTGAENPLSLWGLPERLEGSSDC